MLCAAPNWGAIAPILIALERVVDALDALPTIVK